ncbi:M23 family metallopeptidase [Nocardioides sp.]|uniref:M23 family metallopeptidase n=1 Tax=Nocardioides sp. TaxID=35761 RepID=UPI0039E5E087
MGLITLVTALLSRLPGRLLVILLTGLVLAPGPVSGAAGEPAQEGVWPLSPTPSVVRGFDPPDRPWLAGHRGVDLLGRVGQPVLAALPGTVSFAGPLAGRGVVVVDHGATRTTYEPVSATVAVGDPVAAGQRLGSLDLAGSHCLPAACLHLGLIRNADDVYLDPLTLFGPRPVRLLPLWRDEPAAPSTGGLSGVPADTRAPLRPSYARWLAPLQKLRLILER